MVWDFDDNDLVRGPPKYYPVKIETDRCAAIAICVELAAIQLTVQPDDSFTYEELVAMTHEYWGESGLTDQDIATALDSDKLIIERLVDGKYRLR